MAQEDKLKEAKRLYQTANADQKYVLERLFPELKESDDERIRKALIEYFKWNAQQILNEYTNREVLAWLESQDETSPVLSNSLNIGKVEQKPADKVEPKIIDWSKHIKYEPNSPSIIKENPAWSEEDDKMFVSIMYSPNFIGEQKAWLESLKDRVLPQPKQEWSEEDERNLQGIIDEIEANKNEAANYDHATYDRFLSWLKSISPQKQWKPTEEQMGALLYYTSQSPILLSLYNDLKAIFKV